MKKVSNYIPELLEKYYVTKKGNVYSKVFNADDYIEIINLRKEGLTYKDISNNVGISQSTVYRLSQKHPLTMYKKLNGRKDKDGYIEYTLYTQQNETKYFRGHRIVGYCFLNLKDDLQINHKNGIKKDNRLENLEVVTQSENAKHSYEKLGNDYTKNLPDDRNMVKVKSLSDNQKYTFESLTECCQAFTEFSYGYLSQKPKNKLFKYHKKYMIKIFD